MRRLFLIVVFWGSIPVFFIDPFYGIVHYTLINIIRPEQLLWGSGVGRIYYADQLACFASWLVNREKLTPEYTPVTLQMKLLWILAFEMTLITYTVAVNTDVSWRWTLQFIKATIFCFMMLKSINTAKKLELYYAASIVWFTLLEIWGIQQKLGGNDRMEGLGGDQLPDVNGLAAVAVMYFPMAYYMLFSRTRWIKLFIGIPSFIIFVIFILFGGSRGAFLGLIACLMVFFIRAKGTQKFKMLFTLIIGGVLLIAILNQFAPEGFWDEYKTRLTTIQGEEDEETGEVNREGSSAGRIAMWKGAITVYKNNRRYWLLGVGMNCYARMYIEHIDEIAEVLDSYELQILYRRGRGGKDMHNTYLNILLGGGAVTFLTWIFLVFYVWLQAHTIPRKYPQIVDGVDIHNYAKAIEVGIIGYCVSISFASMEFIDFFYWHLTMSGIIVNLGKAKLKREELGQEEEGFMAEPGIKSVYAPYSH